MGAVGDRRHDGNDERQSRHCDSWLYGGSAAAAAIATAAAGDVRRRQSRLPIATAPPPTATSSDAVTQSPGLFPAAGKKEGRTPKALPEGCQGGGVDSCGLGYLHGTLPFSWQGVCHRRPDTVATLLGWGGRGLQRPRRQVPRETSLPQRSLWDQAGEASGCGNRRRRY